MCLLASAWVASVPSSDTRRRRLCICIYICFLLFVLVSSKASPFVKPVLIYPGQFSLKSPFELVWMTASEWVPRGNKKVREAKSLPAWWREPRGSIIHVLSTSLFAKEKKSIPLAFGSEARDFSLWHISGPALLDLENLLKGGSLTSDLLRLSSEIMALGNNTWAAAASGGLENGLLIIIAVSWLTSLWSKYYYYFYSLFFPSLA